MANAKQVAKECLEGVGYGILFVLGICGYIVLLMCALWLAGLICKIFALPFIAGWEWL